MSTGAAGGAYDEQARRYQTILARSGVELRLMPSAGAAENLQRLNDPASGVSVGFVQGGLAEKPSPDLASLGTISVEPIWLFYRGAQPGTHFEGLRGRKISIGPEGSGSHGIALEWLARNGFEPGAATLLPLPLVVALASPPAGALSGKIGPRWILVAGPIIVAAGFLLTVRMVPGRSYWLGVLPAMIVIAVGMAGAVAPLTTAALMSVDDQHVGAASGFNSTVSRTGGLVATALIGSVIMASGLALLKAFGVAAAAGAVLCVGASLSAFFFIPR